MSRLPRSLGPDHLVLSHFTLERHHPVADRIAAAAAAGFDAVGLYALGEGFDALPDLLEEHDLGVADLEVVKGWAGGEDAAIGADIEARAFALADRFASRCLQAIGSYSGSIDDAGRAFGALCDRAADHGLVVALEPLPYTNIGNLATAAEVVDRAGRDNGGLCVDIWHQVRAGDRLDAVAALGADRIMCVQVNDGPRVQPDNGLGYKDDCLRNRVPPGEGEMDTVGFVRALLAAGTSVPWSVEVPSEPTWGQPALAHVGRCADAMRRVLAAAREEVPA